MCTIKQVAKRREGQPYTLMMILSTTPIVSSLWSASHNIIITKLKSASNGSLEISQQKTMDYEIPHHLYHIRIIINSVQYLTSGHNDHLEINEHKPSEKCYAHRICMENDDLV